MLRILTVFIAISGALGSPWQGKLKVPQAEEVCYDTYGCFSNNSPWTSSVRPKAGLPGRPEEVGTRHLLFTRTTRNDAEELLPGKDALLEFSQYNGARSTVVIVHGWTDNSTTQWVVKTKNALLDKEDYNILAIDWAPGATGTYLKAVDNARLVGAQIAALLQFIIGKTATTPAKIHIIGHSLGAHIAAYVGNRIDNIAKITALDPSQPYFEGAEPLVRLDTSDADFIQVIHSNAKSASRLEGFGVTSAVGHIDIYPNGGESQPGCKDQISKLKGNLNDLLAYDFNGFFSEYACSHSRAPEFYAESLNSECPFVSYPCADYKTFEQGSCYSDCQDGSCLVIGNDKDNVQPGHYFLKTDEQASFCLQPATMSSGVSPSQEKVDHGKVTVQFRRPDGITTDKFVLAEGVINAEDNLSHHVDVPSAFLPNFDTTLTASLHYSRTGLIPGLDPKTLALQGLTVSFLDRELQLHTKKFYGVTLESGVDVIVGEEK